MPAITRELTQAFQARTHREHGDERHDNNQSYSRRTNEVEGNPLSRLLQLSIQIISWIAN
jgi:hypothetical protein